MKERKSIVRDGARGRRLLFTLTSPLLLAASLQARVIRVPEDYPTIKGAVFAAEAGDVVDVDDGTYFEDCVRLDKPMTVRARNTYGAVIYGGSRSKGLSAIFIVQAPVEVAGFVLKNSRFGLIQRLSPDVGWSAHHLFIFNMSRAAVAIKSQRSNIGRASVANLVVDGCAAAFQTSEAHSLDVRRCLVANCAVVFQGYNHKSFTADEVAAWNCGRLVNESYTEPGPGATNRIILKNVRDFSSSMINGPEPLDRNPRFAGILEQIRASSFFGSLSRISREILQGFVSRMLGEVALAARRPQEARAHFRRALEIGREQGFDELTWTSRKGLADAFRLGGESRKALDLYEQAAREVEDIRSGYAFKLYNPGYLEDKISLYESLLGVFYELHLGHPREGYDLRALELVENTKARGFLQSLKEGEWFRTSVRAMKIRPERIQLNRRISDIQVALQSESLKPAERDVLLDGLERALEDVKSTFIQVRAKNPGQRHLPLFEGTSAKRMREELLDDQTLLIEFFLGERSAYAFGLTKKALTFVRLDPPKVIVDLVVRYRRFLTMGNGRTFAGMAGSRRLSRTLVAPFSGLMAGGVKRIIIVPSEILHYLPFETLQAPGRGRSVAPRYLIENFEVVYAPSASAILTIRDRPRPMSLPLDFLGVSYPGRGERKTVYMPTPCLFPQLRWAEEEIRSAAAFFRADRARILAGPSVTESDVLGLPLGQARILHFATHGLSDDENWQRSALLFGPDQDNGRDGFLQLQDIYLLDLNADLVVLSGCRTALGRLEKGEGLTGWPLTFLYAGTRSFLSSLWSIADESSVPFMKAFYSRLAGGLTRSAALRAAKMTMLRGRYSHPFYWAGFILIGEDGVLFP